MEDITNGKTISTLPRWDGSEYIGERYDNCFVVYTHHRDSDVLQESNWRSIIRHFDANPHINYKVVRASHWAVGWVEMILVEDHDIASVCFAELIQTALRDYPIFNEEDFSELEAEAVDEIVDIIRSDIGRLAPGEELAGWEPIDRHTTDERIREIVYERGWALD